MKTKSLILFVMLVSSGRLFAQTADSLRIISPGLSPAVVAHRKAEVALFNQLTTEKSTFRLGTMVETSRYTTLYHTLMLGYGLERHNRLNIGGIFIMSHVRVDLEENHSPFAILGKGKGDGLVVRKPAAAGLYLRGVPFRRLPEFTVQTGLLFPGTKDELVRQLTGYDRILAQLQLSFYQQFRPWFYLFATAEADVLFANDTRKQTSLLVPVSLYPVFRLGYGSNTYLFASLGYSGRFNKVEPGCLKSNGYRVQYGLGVQHYFTPDFSLFGQVQ